MPPKFIVQYVTTVHGLYAFNKDTFQGGKHIWLTQSTFCDLRCMKYIPQLSERHELAPTHPMACLMRLCISHHSKVNVSRVGLLLFQKPFPKGEKVLIQFDKALTPGAARQIRFSLFPVHELFYSHGMIT